MDSMVTIITPVYNCARFVNETIDSVMAQDYTDLHHLVIDDASTDYPCYPRVTSKLSILRNSVNLGEQNTVNKALQHVKGKYFMIVNADDLLLPGAVSNLVEFMEANPEVLCGYPDYNVIGEDGTIRWHVTSRDYDFKWWIQHHTWLPSVGSIFRSSLIKTIGYRDISFRWLGDADYWLRVGLVGDMAHVPMTLACWRNRDGQATKQKSGKRAKEHIRVMRKFFATPNLPQQLLDVRAEATCWSYLVASVVTSSKVDLIKYIVKALYYYPGLLVSYRFWDILIKKVWYLLRR